MKHLILVISKLFNYEPSYYVYTDFTIVHWCMFMRYMCILTVVMLYVELLLKINIFIHVGENSGSMANFRISKLFIS